MRSAGFPCRTWCKLSKPTPVNFYTLLFSQRTDGDNDISRLSEWVTITAWAPASGANSQEKAETLLANNSHVMSGSLRVILPPLGRDCYWQTVAHHRDFGGCVHEYVTMTQEYRGERKRCPRARFWQGDWFWVKNLKLVNSWVNKTITNFIPVPLWIHHYL